MYDLPAAKRVRRADLYSPSPEPSDPDEALVALLYSKLNHVYGPIITDTTSNPPAKNALDIVDRAPPVPEPNEGFEFRLFATSREPLQAVDASGPDISTQRIIIDEELAVGALHRQGGFVVPRRDERYYFSGAVPPERRKEFELAAMTGEDVRRLLEVRYPGLAVPWRVRHLRNGQLLAAPDGPNEVAAAPLVAGLKPNASHEIHPSSLRPKGKPGKKRRVLLRVRKKKMEEAARRRLEEAERKKKTEAEREEADREKRTRRNREKKVKKKMKEREKKLALGGNGSVDLDKERDSEKEETSS